MSIATEISRLQTAKADIKTSIEGKGVTVPSATTLDGYATLIDAISAGGGVTTTAVSVASPAIIYYTDASMTLKTAEPNAFGYYVIDEDLPTGTIVLTFSPEAGTEQPSIISGLTLIGTTGSARYGKTYYYEVTE